MGKRKLCQCGYGAVSLYEYLIDIKNAIDNNLGEDIMKRRIQEFSTGIDFFQTQCNLSDTNEIIALRKSVDKLLRAVRYGTYNQVKLIADRNLQHIFSAVLNCK